MSIDALKKLIAHHWGFPTLRQLQEPAMQAVLDGRDSLVVMPTGGGKSLCYQAPAVHKNQTTVVASPLISLMKDQVDSLRSIGIPAVQIDSSLSETERFAYEMDIRDGAVRLVFVSPERLVMPAFQSFLRGLDIRTFAIDEAHCISHWGHDFRPEYRQLGKLKTIFPGCSVHAYTATATEQVRGDIITQLGLQSPEVLVGNFDRPNLTYRVVPRRDLLKQAREVIDRHQNEAGIIYCIRRKDVDELTADLRRHGYKPSGYHGGMEPEERTAVQDAFTREQCNLIVATVAFGMGIDRSNIRFVLHTGMPKSIEHYQQETGRAGRDGLGAECVLLYSGSDALLWKSIVEKSAAEAGAHPSFLQSAMRHLDDMDRYSRGASCRHRSLVNYFGQVYEAENCLACDLCLAETEDVNDALVVAQKILSCVARVKERFGVGHVISVLRGEDTEKVRKFGHEQLTTYRLLHEHGKADVRDWIYQLIGQGVLTQSTDEFPVLKLNAASWEVMKGKRAVRLVRMGRKAESKGKSSVDVSWEGVDRELFESLRELRYGVAEQRGVPPYIVFNDATLRQLAAVRPSSLEKMHYISGVGDTKLRDFGERFLAVIHEHCAERGLAADVAPPPVRREAAAKPARSNSPKKQAIFELFRQGAVIEDAMHQSQLARSTVVDYLAEFIREERPKSIALWVSDKIYRQVADAARQVGGDRLKPIYLTLGEKISYDEIRLVLANLGPKTT